MANKIDETWMNRCVQEWNLAPKYDIHHWAREFGYDLIEGLRASWQHQRQAEYEAGRAKDTIASMKEKIVELEALVKECAEEIAHQKARANRIQGV